MPTYRHIYLHVPFCDVICHYCHFYTARTKETDQKGFFAALELEAKRALPEIDEKIDAIYFGGGTPGASPPELIAHFLAPFRDRFHPHTEITLETNPSNVTKESTRAWSEAGINRISLGVQSLDDPTLQRLGRAHSSAQAKEALSLIVSEIPNVTCDLIYSVPEQPETKPAAHAKELIQLGAKHLSFYHLTLEKEHFLHSRLPTDSFAWSQLKHVADFLGPLGFHHYEIASFALPERESRNNKNYWSGGSYMGFGPSAHGFNGARERWSNVSDWREYIRLLEAGESARAWTENLTASQRRIEVIFTTLRTSEGLDLDAFKKNFGEDLRHTHSKLFFQWQNEGLANVTNGSLTLTFSGRMLADEIARLLL